MYKKLFVSLFAVALIFGFTGISMANGPYSDAYQGTDYVAGSNYTASSPYFTIGGANAKVYDPKGGDFAGSYVAGAYSAQKVKSSAWGFGPGGGPETATAYGEAMQYSGAVVDRGNGNFAAGMQSSGAGYYAHDTGCWYASANGKAKTIGGTLVGAGQINTPNSSTGIAGAVVGSAGKAKAYGDNCDTWTYGSGKVKHGTYANKGGGEAWTGGNAAYDYDTDGNRRSAGAGFAATGGISNVTYRNNGSITASAMSGSISSTGNGAYTNGGTHISSFSMP